MGFQKRDEQENGQDEGTGGTGKPHKQTFTPSNVDLDCHETVMRGAAAEVEYEEMVAAFENPWSYNRDRMAGEKLNLCALLVHNNQLCIVGRRVQ
jgi:hypothetical protein